MPPNPAINNTVRILLNFRIGSAFLGQTHIDLRGNGVAGETDFSGLVDDIGGLIISNDVNDAWSTDVTVPEWEAHNLDDPDLVPTTYVSTLTGGEAGDPLPENVAALVSLRSDFSGRSNRGRAYWPGYTEASSDGASFNTTSAGHLADFYDDLNGLNLNGFPLELVVVSFKNAIARAITSVIVEAAWATMRNRLERLR